MTRSYEDSPWGPLGGSRTNWAHWRDWPANKDVAMGQTTREKPKEQRRDSHGNPIHQSVLTGFGLRSVTSSPPRSDQQASADDAERAERPPRPTTRLATEVSEVWKIRGGVNPRADCQPTTCPSGGRLRGRS